MTVNELIKELSKLDKDAVVKIKIEPDIGIQEYDEEIWNVCESGIEYGKKIVSIS